MKILYISSRLNSPDGSSVHGRAFYSCVKKLGHEIHTYPEILPLKDISKGQGIKNKNIFFYIKKLHPKKILNRLKRLNSQFSKILDFLEGMFRSLTDFYQLHRIIKQFNPDVIVYRQRTYSFAGVWASMTSGIPCVAEVNALKAIEKRLSDGLGSSKKKLFSKKTGSGFLQSAVIYPLKRSDRIFCVSSVIKQNLDAFLDPDRVSVIPNGVDADVFDRSRFDQLKVKEELGILGKMVIGYVGSYQPWHGVQISLDVIKKMNQVNSDFHLLLIGNGPEFSIIKQKVQQQGLESCVTQIDYVLHAYVPELLAAFDLALMTYPVFDEFYFSPLKMYEYMAMGIPVISTDIGQIRDVIEDGKTGVLVKKPTSEEFIVAIQSLADDKNYFKKMSHDARQVAVQKHSWLVNAKQVLDLCSDILTTKR